MARAVIDVVFSIDVSATLALIQAPTLVLHRREDRAIPFELGRELASGVRGAKFVELRGEDHVPWAGDIDALVDEIASFLTGTRTTGEPDRALATVLFTDIVHSTEVAARMGDREWRDLLERHDALSREQVNSYGGRVVKSLGDGMLAVFSGPARAVHCAQALSADVGELGIALRAGVHTGEVEIIGPDVAGMAVHLGARVRRKSKPGRSSSPPRYVISWWDPASDSQSLGSMNSRGSLAHGACSDSNPTVNNRPRWNPPRTT